MKVFFVNYEHIIVDAIVGKYDAKSSTEQKNGFVPGICV